MSTAKIKVPKGWALLSERIKSGEDRRAKAGDRFWDGDQWVTAWSTVGMPVRFLGPTIRRLTKPTKGRKDKST